MSYTDPTTKKKYLFDTTVIIDYLKGHSQAKQWVDCALDGMIDAGISPLVDFELWIGVRDEKEARRHKALLAKFRRLQFQATIARNAGELYRPYLKNKAVSIPDAIMAATADYYSADIVTRNPKHFELLPLEKAKVVSYQVDEGKKKQA
ncbi:MAG TPA: type II toxin-antitoxin system VapC family toxin [Dissulfurispiraceae bacterium]|nr:type II toxin-antitoxin system VapC family toxin [Dissulfurispiraceae bacterium]